MPLSTESTLPGTPAGVGAMPVELVLANSVAEQVQQLSQSLLNLLFPPRCVVCRRVGTYLCAGCLRSFTPVSGPTCEICSTSLPAPGLCGRCAARRPAFMRVRSAFWYEGAVRQAILGLKYRRLPALAPLLVDAMTRVLPPPEERGMVLCAVPMHPAQLARRGYNHAGLIADHLARTWNLPLLGADALQRSRPASRQVELDYTARLANVRGVFVARRDAVQGCTVLLVDDVCTTGATLNACAEALLAAGASATFGVTLARTL